MDPVRLPSLIVLGLFLLLSGSSQAESKDPWLDGVLQRRADFDKKTYRALTLKNQLRVLLVRDPDASRCAASMDVFVGSYNDPADMQGMAHYLEHVLFMGTKKYPKLGEYHTFMNNNQGMANAFTAGEDTNYMFQVNEDAFSEGLDRFAWFFIEPTFDAGNLDKEKNAVNSEYDKNIKNDYWRKNALIGQLARKGHPLHRFTIGNLETLKKVSREDVLRFYKKYYSANTMTLAVYCRNSLDDMEKDVRRSFAAIPNRKLSEPAYDKRVFARKDLPRLVSFKPVKNKSELTYVFPLPGAWPFVKSKPVDVLAWFIGREGSGSLFSVLKEEGLITKLSAWPNRDSAWTLLMVNMELTPKGEKNPQKIGDLFFSYMNRIRENGYKKHVFEFIKSMREIDFVFAPPQMPMRAAIGLSMGMRRFPPLLVQARQTLVETWGPKDFSAFIDLVVPENLTALLQSPSVKTDRKEKYFGIEYAVKPLGSWQVERWRKMKPDPRFAYPQKNPMVPDNLQVMDNDKAKVPYKILDDKQGEIWFQQDHVFRSPRAKVSWLLLTPEGNRDGRSVVASELWVRLLMDSLSAWRDMLTDAGIRVNLARRDRGLMVDLSGYSQRLPRVIREIQQKVLAFRPEKSRFADLKTALQKEYKNIELKDSYRLALENMGIAEDMDRMHYADYRQAVDGLTFADLQAFGKRYLARTALQGLAYGNLSKDDVLPAFTSIFAGKGPGLLPRKDWPRTRFTRFPAGSPAALLMPSHTNNNAWTRKVQFGPRTPETEAVVRLLGDYMRPQFFSDLRDKQQLGYIVSAGASNRRAVAGIYYLIQSQQYGAGELARRADRWTADRLAGLDKELDEAKFAGLKKALISSLQQRDDDMDDRFGRLRTEALYLNGDFNYRKKLIAALEKINKKDFIKQVRAAFAAPGISSFSVYVPAAGKPQPKVLKGEKVIGNLRDHKAGLQAIN